MLKSSVSYRLAFVAAWLGIVSVAPAEWTNVGQGIDYQEFHTPDPNNLYVARMSRDNSQCFVDSTLGGLRLGISETIGAQAARYDDAMAYWHDDWGLRNDVIVAINGDFLDTSNNTPLMGMMMSGWYMKQVEPGNIRFAYTMAQDLAIGSVSPGSIRVSVPASGLSRSANGVNRVRSTDELIVYTHHYYSTTRTDSTGTEVAVEMTRPMLTVPTTTPVVGTVRQVRPNAGSTQIPFDYVVLSGVGSSAMLLNASLHVGDVVNVAVPTTGTPIDPTKTYGSIGGGEVFLSNGYVVGGQAIRHPRTAIAYNGEYLFFVCCDGRDPSVSVGMTMDELAHFCQDYLVATDGINQDGGGSSTMIVNGVLKNDPSDGSQRDVVNGIFMGVTQSKLQSTTFNSGDTIKTGSSNVTVRLGPGSHFLSAGTVGKNTTGTILDHHLRGVYAKAAYWWKCDFGSIVGWVSQTSLTLVTASTWPAFTQHPAGQTVCPGSNAAFTVAATGSGLAYQWQFNGTNVTDNAVYAGATTPALTLTAPTTSENGSYRCVVTGSTGTTTSYSAPLHIANPTTVVNQPASLVDPLVARGTNAEFTMRGKGEGSVSYRWRKNGVNLTDSAKYAGAYTPSLTVMNVDTYDEGMYTCAITAACGTLVTNEAELKVRSADFNRDGFVDLADFGHLQACLTGSTNPQTDPYCRDADIVPDVAGDVGLEDLSAFVQCLTGPGTVRQPGC